MRTFQNAYLGGTFDCLHRGHLALFAQARRIAAQVTVSVNTDAFAARYKRAPLMPLADRLAVLHQCRLVDRVVVNIGDEDSRPAILHAEADCIVHGSDWHGEALLRQMGLTADWLAERRLELVILPYTPITTTSDILKAYDARRVA
jgi:cytidyltransferase-like protein